jgi:hypothetical protein
MPAVLLRAKAIVLAHDGTPYQTPQDAFLAASIHRG